MTDTLDGTVLDTAARIRAGVESVLAGKPDAVRMSLTVLLAGGHLLIEDVPGVGKTLLAKSLARTLGVSVRRLQFTPDLLPSDVTGVSVFNQETREFEFRPGAIFANIVLADEINRASPKTQSALLEAMEERQVSIDGHTHELASPFLVIATQNPVDMEGTYALPEAQRDRFMARISMGYPAPADELRMLTEHAGADPLDSLLPAATHEELTALMVAVAQVHVSEPVRSLAVAITTATRRADELRLGASPRATLHLVRAARSWAALEGRTFVLPDDLHLLAPTVLGHRVLLATSTAAAGRTGPEVVSLVLGRIPRSAWG
ncbi:MAG TPA: MoxR family ATPase [Candidatus Nanopelagicales bacterium]